RCDSSTCRGEFPNVPVPIWRAHVVDDPSGLQPTNSAPRYSPNSHRPTHIRPRARSLALPLVTEVEAYSRNIRSHRPRILPGKARPVLQPLQVFVSSLGSYPLEPARRDQVTGL